MRIVDWSLKDRCDCQAYFHNIVSCVSSFRLRIEESADVANLKFSDSVLSDRVLYAFTEYEAELPAIFL